MGFDLLHSTGYVGATRKNGDGCSCHGNHAPTDSVHVWLEGPDTMRYGTIAAFTLFMHGGPAVAGGFNVASGTGILSPFDGTSKISNSELTQTDPILFVNDTVEWRFLYQAPVSGQVDTLFSVGNSVNSNGNPSGDQYNFGENFLVYLQDTTTNVQEEYSPSAFRLDQNYTNPFNPKTEFGFRIADFGFVSFKVYDVIGKEVITLVNGRKEPGEYVVSWDAGGLATGIYFYELRTSNYSQVRKMTLIR